VPNVQSLHVLFADCLLFFLLGVRIAKMSRVVGTDTVMTVTIRDITLTGGQLLAEPFNACCGTLCSAAP
jgi:hypothetical protein